MCPDKTLVRNHGGKFALALSGGGVRAMAFHAGVLRWLAEQSALEDVDHVSTVSGGTLFVGLVMRCGCGTWPTSAAYLNSVRSEIRHALTTVDLQLRALGRLALPWNWRFLLSRANVLSKAIEAEWGIRGTLNELPETPTWSVNGTTAETGKRFRFKRTTCGDYQIGYAEAARFKIADAMAISAAFPVGIGPFVIKTRDFEWQKRDTWDGEPETEKVVVPPFGRLHIYDGGVYDNFGLEPLFDVGKQMLKPGTRRVVLSDAGAPFRMSDVAGRLNPFRVRRLMDITMEQVRALRVRSLVHCLEAHRENGAYLQIGSVPIEKIRQFAGRNPSAAAHLLSLEWLNAVEVGQAAGHATTLRRMRAEEYDRLERHGFETAKWNAGLFGTAAGLSRVEA